MTKREIKLRFVCLQCGKSGGATVDVDSEQGKTLVRCNYNGKDEITIEDCKDRQYNVIYFHHK